MNTHLVPSGHSAHVSYCPGPQNKTDSAILELAIARLPPSIAPQTHHGFGRRHLVARPPNAKRPSQAEVRAQRAHRVRGSSP